MFCFLVNLVDQLPETSVGAGREIQEGWGDGFHVKKSRILVVSLRGVNHGFWSPLGC